MNEWIASNRIKEVFGGQNIIYEVNDNSDFLLTGYKVLKSQNSNSFVRCNQFLFNGKIRLLYSTSEMRPLNVIAGSINANVFLRILSSLFGSIINIKNNGFLMISNLDLSIDKIFVNTTMMNAALMYLPLLSTNVNEEKVESYLRKQIIDLINSNPTLYNSTVAAFSSELANGAKTINDLYDFLRTNGIHENQFQQEFNRRTNPPVDVVRQPEMQFTTYNSIYSLRFVINKPEFILGKNELMVDGAITFNGAISRKHCKIVYDNGQYFIEDLGSVNGTYINNYRIQPGERQPLQKGDIVKLANSEFIVEF